jgi:RND superfamily putative drug exporter
MRSNLYKLGRYAARRPWVVIGAWIVVAALVVAASGAFGKKLEDTFGAPGVDSQSATDLLSAAGADQAGLTAQIVVSPRDEQETLAEPELRAAMTQLQSAADRLPKVLDVSDPVLSPDGRVGLIRLQYPVLDDLDPGDLDELKSLAGMDTPLRIEMGGDLFYAFEQGQAGLGEGIGVVAAMVILLLAFGSVIAMGLPIGMALFGLALGVSSLSLVTYLVELPSWAPVLGSMIGLGVGIDYALMVVTRHREFLALGMSVEESAGRAVATAGQSVLFAGGTVVIAILGLVVAGVPFMTAGG